jgi:hypothetical protein
MRYLSELAWVPHAMRATRALEWRELVDEVERELAPKARAESRQSV